MKKRHRLLTFLVTLFALFDLLVCGMGCYAWFVTKNTVSASGIQMRIYTQDLDLSYKIYKYSDDEKCAIDVTNQDDALALQEYDSVITSRNDNTPIIIEFNLRGEKITGDNSICLSVTCTDPATDTRYLSNIVGLKFATTTAITGDSTADIYDSAVNYFKDVNSYTFKNGDNKTSEIVYTATNYTSYIVNNVLKIYMQLDYEPSLVQQFEFSFDDVTTTSFTNDLTLMRFYIET